jgi:hypothetical protein
MAALYGGRIEAQWRGEIESARCDITKCYPTNAALLGLQRFLMAERIDFMEATQEARRIVAAASLAGVLDPGRWPDDMPFLCWVRPEGAAVPIFGDFGKLAGGPSEEDGAAEFNCAMPHRDSGEAGLVPLFMPDVIAAAITGRAPEIVYAERLIPVGRRRTKKVRLPSGAVLDPAMRDIFITLVEEGERLSRNPLI